VGRDQDENPGVGGVSSQLYKERKGGPATSSCPSQNGTAVYNVCDISVLAVSSTANNTIVDDVNGPTLSFLTDPTVGMYILGEQVTAGNSSAPIGNSRFRTSPSLPSWIVGTTNMPSTPCAVGDLYSITTGTTGTTLWGCVGPNLGTAWESIK